MIQVISGAIAAVVALLCGYMIWFPESGGPRPGAEFGTGLLWSTFALYGIGCLLWVVGLIGLMFARQRYQVILQLASAVVYFYPVVLYVFGIVWDRSFAVHLDAEYVLEWKAPAEWQNSDFECEVSYVGGIGRCHVERGPIRDNLLELSGGPVHVRCERQFLCLQVRSHEQQAALGNYIFLVDLRENKGPGEISNWILPQSCKPGSGNRAGPQFVRDGDASGFSPMQDPIVQMRYRVISIQRQQGR